ncbi:thiol-disulfide oxidoreductase DCC family protein [Qipengyuania qiaonensis]|uniref:Thiol-disulfide oxidoreductase DCC family protein n=1 Tax=Qipengyuania qiaonensis TaxID=2867240 RepID=A0ABS7J7Q4_9SPHN|nr:thiol-disulfide oxidoreductase DCC family protein [Qipengyuania qiaonensis]MBX7483353.1 thiol-disulfide oxidoreductase DCC family protein [Qipengyuania qiaonensis]
MKHRSSNQLTSEPESSTQTSSPAEVSPVIVYDGHCVLCSANARFVLKHDRQGRFRLAAMQGPAGAALMRRVGVDPDDPDTLIVVDGMRVLRDSNAVLAIWAGLGWPWRVSTVFQLIPRALRDFVYRLIARNRYRLFGWREQCFVPDARWQDRIL